MYIYKQDGARVISRAVFFVFKDNTNPLKCNPASREYDISPATAARVDEHMDQLYGISGMVIWLARVSHLNERCSGSFSGLHSSKFGNYGSVASSFPRNVLNGKWPNESSSISSTPRSSSWVIYRFSILQK